jgi:hypothetical protein
MSHLISSTTEGEEALAAATAETILQVRGVTTQKVELAEVSLAGDQEATTEIENINWRILYQSTDGTATGATEVPQNPDDPTPAITLFHSFTAEPTAGNVIAEGEIPANGELYRYWADGEGPTLDNATTSRIGLEATASIIVNVKAYWRWRVVSA